MLLKMNEYRGVIIFYLLLILILVFSAYRNKQIDMQNPNISNYSINANN